MDILRFILVAVIEGILPWWLVLGALLLITFFAFALIAGLAPEQKLSTTFVVRLFDGHRQIKKREIGTNRPAKEEVARLVASFFDGNEPLALVGSEGGPWRVLLGDAMTAMTVQVDRVVS